MADMRPGGTARSRVTSRIYPAPPVVDRERGDAWGVARRAEWAAAIVEDVLRRGFRVLVDMDDDSPASCVVYSPRGMLFHWRGAGTPPSHGPAPHLITEQLAAYIVTRHDLTSLSVEEDGKWHKLPCAPGQQRKDTRTV